MTKSIWVIEVNMDSIDSLEFRVRTAEDMLKTNAVHALIKAGELSAESKLPHWIAIAMAHNEKEALQKLERFKKMTVAEKVHAASTGESLYLKVSQT